LLDDKPIMGLDRFRVVSAVFPFTGLTKEDAVFPDAVGKIKVVSDGYWIMLKPLPVGTHNLKFKGTVKAADGKKLFELDVTYELTVERK
jgi:hypothetical protein